MSEDDSKLLEAALRRVDREIRRGRIDREVQRSQADASRQMLSAMNAVLWRAMRRRGE